MQSKQPKPPQLAIRFLLWFLKEELAEEVLGDLKEKFDDQVKTSSIRKAKFNYWIQVFHYLRPFALRNNIFSTINPFFMWRHNLLISFRNFKKNTASFLINLIGLSTGLACTLLIYLWVVDEINMDKFHENDAQLYQVMLNSHRNVDLVTWESTPAPLAAALIQEIPEVKLAVNSLVRGKRGIISKEEQLYKVKDHYVGKDFFQLFSYPILHGDAQQVLKDKNSVAISDQLALQLFKTTENVVGQTINFTRKHPEISGDFIISAVYKNPPKNSTMQFDLAFSWELYFSKRPNLAKWQNSGPNTYLQLKKGTDLKKVTQKMNDLLKGKHSETLYTLFVRPYSDGYLYNNYENGVQAGGRIMYVRLFSLIAFFILLIACINFMNLSTAKATKRIKEIGVKKAIGADRGTLIGQYLCESMLITGFSLLLAIVAVEMVLPHFNNITEKTLVLQFSPQLAMSICLIGLVTGLLAGSYPALYLSGFNPAAVLKGKINKSVGELWARKGLVIVQFSLSISLIIAVSVIYQQINYIQSKNLGYNKDNIISFFREGELANNLTPFLAEVRNLTGVVNATNIGGNLTGDQSYTTGVYWPGRNADNPTRFRYLDVNPHFMETLGFKIKEGRSYSNEFGAESGNIIINEAAVKAFGFKKPIGSTFKLWDQHMTVIGVVKNFHFESLYEEVKPGFLRRANNGRNILVKIQSGKEQTTIAQIEKLYQSFNPGYAFQYRFIDEQFDQLYASEHRVSILSRYFAGMGILISCLGLFGLAAFSAERRTKEIGIRKVLGASTLGIVSLLSKDFTRMVLISILIAVPLSYYWSSRWLESFAFRIELEPWIFIGAGLAALGIAWLSVGFQMMKAAQVNLVHCLKAE